MENEEEEFQYEYDEDNDADDNVVEILDSDDAEVEILESGSGRGTAASSATGARASESSSSESALPRCSACWIKAKLDDKPVGTRPAGNCSNAACKQAAKERCSVVLRCGHPCCGSIQESLMDGASCLPCLFCEGHAAGAGAASWSSSSSSASGGSSKKGATYSDACLVCL